MSEDEDKFSPVYKANRREWMERYGRYRSEARMWRVVSLGLMVTTGIAVSGATWLASQAHVVPYVIEVNKLGESLTVQRLEASMPVDPTRIKPALAQWVSDVRSVYKDPDAQAPLYTQAYAWVDQNSSAKGQLDQWYAAHRPNIRATKESASVSIEAVYPQGGDIWIVDWKEVSDLSDKPEKTSYWRMNVRIKQAPPKSDAEILNNPGGLYIEWFNMTERQQ